MRTRDRAPLASRAGEVCHFFGKSVQRSLVFREPPLELIARFFVCAQCRGLATVCSLCDRGQRYCSRHCSHTARRRKQREAGRRYQLSRRGRHHHANRQRRYRARQNKVTHQGSSWARESALLSEGQPSRTTGLPLPAVGGHCAWCKRAVSAFVRLRFLKNRRGGRTADRFHPPNGKQQE